MQKSILLLCCFISLLHGMEIIRKKGSDIKNDGINLILSLDDVLLHHSSRNSNGIHHYFLKKSFVVHDSWGNNYIVPAYLSEFLKFVISKFNISFFNDHVDEVNRSVIEDIWLQVFGMRKTESIRILSCNDITDAEKNPELQPKDVGNGLWHGNRKKDVRKVGGLHNTILIDSQDSCVLKGQESNFLSVPANDFFDLKCIVTYHNDRDNKNYEQYMGELLSSERHPNYLLAFYKLLYIAGILDIAAQHEMSIIDGLCAIQCENDMPRDYLQYYKRGYRVLFTFSDGIAGQQKTILHLLQAHPEVHWSVLPPEIRQLIVGYMIQLAKDTMSLFPEIEKHFC